MNRRQYCVALASSMLLPAKAMPDSPDTEDIGNLPRHWFQVTWPDHYRIWRLLENGYRITESAQIRTPMTIGITVSLEDHVFPAGMWRRRHLDGFDKQFRYQFTTDEGGSAGPTYILTAMGYDNDGLPVTMVARKQSELGRPDFSEAWAILATYEIQ